ncbi:hypothetical protein BT96DRAFT_959647 [Gymnopus androsaceus JB14]|uniref:Uncharacterized protein n=1 Tax=Gymnopus androsaceus JB14 TaxID=1447944 RepID=A0A6A4GYP5_9AGAR|nr:hypothetical protein BT96DRAFT_959647 [Gymnopus androsaceus JB14]
MKQEVSGYTYRPFWDELPFCDIHFCITPDVLHQLYQGVLRHIITWCQQILTEKELDCRICCLPPAYGVRHFKNGISALSQISGAECKNMGKILLGSVRAILDFIYLAQYSLHNEDTLRYMDDALNSWHQNKSCFIDLKVHEDLNIPKFHSLEHYVEAIRFLGTTDNYNTKMFECLHIDFAKKDEFPQMTCWLSRQENIHSFDRELTWVLEQRSLTSEAALGPASVPTPPSPIRPILLPKVPTSPNKLITTVQNTHHVPLFSQHLKAYIEMLKQGATRHSVDFALTQHLPFQWIDIYHSFKFSPERGRFDTVIVLTGDAAESVSLIGMLI